MKIILLLVTILIGSTLSLSSEEIDCNKYDKISTEYAKCAANIVKKKSIEIKDKTSTKINNSKKKIKKLNLKKKLIKFRNSKSHKEFTDN